LLVSHARVKTSALYCRARMFRRKLDVRVVAVIAMAALLSVTISAAEGDLKWFRFDKTFIQANYPVDVAFGRLTIEDLYAASALHDVGCSGDDGEIHVGVYDADIAVPGNQRPISRPVGSPPGGWGVVIEPPNATSKDANFLNAFEKTSPRPQQTWDGCLRVWNESHWHGHPTKNPKGFSNPNHVLELHPAWRMTLDDGTERSYSVARIEGFRGYGLNKFDTDDYEFHALNPAEWLKVYQTSASLYVQLVHTANFFSLPVIVRDRDDVAGAAQILDLDVCADRQCNSGDFILQGLRGVTVSAADNNLQFTVGNKIDLLGIFSVNLRVALANATGAVAEQRQSCPRST